MAEVVLEKVGKTYPNGVRAVRGFDLRVEEGELVVLVGPSGCGKTTTLRLIAGLETPTEGTLRIGGRVVNSESPHTRDVAMVFQRPALYPHLTVRENLAFGQQMKRGWFARWRFRFPWWGADRGQSSEESWREVEEAARLLELGPLLDRLPGELSGGQQQRVALGRALARRPAVFLLDEPLSHLDARLRLEMRRELHLLHRRLRATMIYVTHDQEEALTLGDRVAVLDQGVVQQADRAEVVYNRPANYFVAEFLGWPPLNRLEGRLLAEGGDFRLVDGPGSLTVPPGCRGEWQRFAGQKVILGLRPEHVRIRPGRAPRGETDEVVLTMEVRLVERLGWTRLVTLQQAGWTITTRLAGDLPEQEKSRVEVTLDLGHAHLFDAATGRALFHGRPGRLGWEGAG